jgi:ferritin-like protein
VVSEADGVSRRQLLGASGAAGAAALVAGCGLIPTTRPALTKISVTVTRTDIPILEGLLEMEYRLAYAYAASLPPLFDDKYGTRVARWFLHQELAHITALSTLLKSAHAKPSTAPGTFSLGRSRTATDVLSILHRLEAGAIRAYQRAIPNLSHGKLRAIAASIMANEGQHISLVRASLGLDPVPAALLTASE